MKMRLMASLLVCLSTPSCLMRAQGIDANLMSEATAVRAELARSTLALRQYTWTEQTEVLVSGSVKSTKALTCRYDAFGKLLKTPLGAGKDMDAGRATSNRPAVRSKADMRDYIERAVSRIHDYVPPKPEQIDYLLQNGHASPGQSANGNSEIRLTHYFVDGDSLVFTYDSVSKVLLRATIASSLGSPKDPVTLEAIFEILPDGVNHLSSVVLNAKARKVLVRTHNLDYRKAAPWGLRTPGRSCRGASRTLGAGKQAEMGQAERNYGAFTPHDLRAAGLSSRRTARRFPSFPPQAPNETWGTAIS